MNKAILIGRLTRDPDIKYATTSAGEQMCIARYSLAVDRKTKDKATDFINCVAMGKRGEFTEKYLHQGSKIAVSGRIQTGSYEKDGRKVYTTEVYVEECEFAESKKADGGTGAQPSDAGFLNIPEGIEEELPF
jgi:single-strand DNA-binding protein